jgi:hypothetical protein
MRHFYLNVASYAFSCYETESADSDFSSISFVCKANIAEQFESFALKTVISLSYQPECAVACTVYNELLLNIPKSNDRFGALAELLFPNLVTRIFTSHITNDGIISMVDATLICAVTDPNAGRFFLFSFSDGFPDPPNSPEVLDLLSSVPWSDFQLSLLPDVDTAQKQGTIDRPPLGTYASVLRKRHSSFALFVNCNGTPAMSLRVQAVEQAFAEMGRHLPVKGGRTLKRLNGIWKNLDSVSRSIEVILGGAVSADELWGRCCAVTAKGNKATADTRPESAVFVDNTDEMFAISFDQREDSGARMKRPRTRS